MLKSAFMSRAKLKRQTRIQLSGRCQNPGAHVHFQFRRREVKTIAEVLTLLTVPAMPEVDIQLAISVTWPLAADANLKDFSDCGFRTVRCSKSG